MAQVALRMNLTGWRTTMLAICQQARLIGIYGFLIFLPCSIAFSQMCLSLVALSFLIEGMLTRQWPLPRSPVNRPLLDYLAVTLITTLFSVNVAKSFKGLDGLLIIAVYPLFFVALKDRAQLTRWLKVLIVSVTVAVCYGILQHYWEVELFRLKQPISFLKHINDDLTAPVRITGFFSIYMTFSGQLAQMIPIIAALCLAVTSAWKRLCLAIILSLTGAALLWTYTRSAWLGVLAAFTVIGYVLGKRLALLALLVGCLAGTLLLAHPKAMDKSLSLLRDRDEERIYTWITTLDVIKDHPLTGIGKGNYSSMVIPYRERRYGDFEFSSKAHAHNNLLQVSVEAGILGGLCFLWLWGTLFWEAYRVYRGLPETDRLLRWLALGLIGALAAFFTQGVFEHNWGDSETAMMMWLIVALVLKLPSLVSPESEGKIAL